MTSASSASREGPAMGHGGTLTNICVHLSYGKDLELRLLMPARLDDATSAIVRPIRDRPITDLQDLGSKSKE